MKKRYVYFLVLLVLNMTLIACSQTINKDGSDNTQQFYTGYLWIEGDTLKIDSFEFLTTDDQTRIQELGLTDIDMPNGYYIHNESEELIEFSLDEETQYTFYDVSNLFVKEEDDKKYLTKDKDEFHTFLYRGKEKPITVPFQIETKGDKVVSITEIFVN